MQLVVHGCEEGYIPASTCAEVGLSGGKPEPEQAQSVPEQGRVLGYAGRGPGSRRVRVTRPARPQLVQHPAGRGIDLVRIWGFTG